MKFSIVITTYNRLALLKRAIQSSLEQTEPCEVIVVDDASTDGTEAYLQSLCHNFQADQRLIYYRSETNLGHAASVNLGVEKATGDWIKPVDDDDYLAPNCIAEMKKAISLHPQAVICSCQAMQVDEQERELTITRAVGTGKAFYIPQVDLHYGMLLELIPFGTPIQVAFKRNTFLKSGGWDSNLDANFDDIDSWLKIAQFGDAILLNQCLAYRTVWSGSYNQKFSLVNRLKTHILIKRKIYNLVSQEHQHKLPRFSVIENYLKLHWSFVALKQGKILVALVHFFPAFFVKGAWDLLLNRAQKSNTISQLSKDKEDIFFTNYNHQVKEINQQQLRYLKKYLQSRWGLRLLQQGKFFAAAYKCVFACLSLQTWRLSLIASCPNIYYKNRLLKARWNHNFLTMEKIYNLVQAKQNHSPAELKEIKTYQHLRSFLLAFQQRKFISTVYLGLGALCSPLAWKILAKIAYLHKLNKVESPIRSFTLIE